MKWVWLDFLKTTLNLYKLCITWNNRLYSLFSKIDRDLKSDLFHTKTKMSPRSDQIDLSLSLRLSTSYQTRYLLVKASRYKNQKNYAHYLKKHTNYHHTNVKQLHMIIKLIIIWFMFMLMNKCHVVCTNIYIYFFTFVYFSHAHAAHKQMQYGMYKRLYILLTFIYFFICIFYLGLYMFGFAQSWTFCNYFDWRTGYFMIAICFQNLTICISKFTFFCN